MLAIAWGLDGAALALVNRSDTYRKVMEGEGNMEHGVPVAEREPEPPRAKNQSHIAAEVNVRSVPHAWDWRADLWWLGLIAALGIAGSFSLGRRIDPVTYEPQVQDTWFDADISRVTGNMTSRHTNHFRTSVHPLFSLLAWSATTLIGGVTGVLPRLAVKMVLAMAAAALLALFFLLLRLLDFRRPDAAIFTLLLATSASSVFWLGVPDTFVFGSVTILLALCVCALAARRRLSEYWYIAASALTLSCTTTNWMVGIAATSAHLRWRRVVQVTINALFVVTALWGIENVLFKGTQFFFPARSESRWLFHTETGGVLAIAKVFFLHSIVMPAIAVVDIHGMNSAWPLLSVQKASPGSGSVLGLPALVLWVGLLATGLYGIVTERRQMRFKIVLALALLGQLALHLVYGYETFLFAPHFTPLLILVAALGTTTKARPIVLIAAIALVLCCLYNNTLQFDSANHYIHVFSVQHSTTVP